jgi:GNAT superfamily N-acetyltransferase
MNMDRPRVRELSPDETHLSYPAMLELRPKIGTVEEFVERINRVQRPEGYRLVAAFEGRGEEAAAVGGFRVSHFLAWGHAMYCDDLSTRETHRGKGFGGALLEWMLAEARRLGCDEFHLDSGVGADRQDAHRLYLNKRMRISSHHFSMKL